MNQDPLGLSSERLQAGEDVDIARASAPATTRGTGVETGESNSSARLTSVEGTTTASSVAARQAVRTARRSTDSPARSSNCFQATKAASLARRDDHCPHAHRCTPPRNVAKVGGARRRFSS